MNKEELEYEQYCNEQLRNKITNLEYKIKRLEEDKNQELETRIQKAIEYIWSTKYEWGDLDEDNEDFDIDVYKLLDILEGDKNESN